MRGLALRTCLVVGCCAVGVWLWRVRPTGDVSEGSRGTGASAASGWDRRAAADYLDRREVWWQGWPRAQKDHGTICISCHTVVPYALSRPALRQDMGKADMAGPEKVMLASVEKRVTDWVEMVPFYSEANGVGKTAEAHATEAVLNAVILTSYDVQGGHLRPVTRTALDELWALQEETGEYAGAWKWQNFHLGPWEGSESAYQGAAQLMVELGKAPDEYANEAAVRPHVERVKDFLRRGYASQPLMNQMYVLWASARMEGLLTEDERRAVIEQLRAAQQKDGGWRLGAIDKGVIDRKSRIPWLREWREPTESDGCATALVVLALEESGVGRNDEMVRRGVTWLEQHQEKDGKWLANSINKKRDPKTDAALFMSDAATGYAVLALEKVQ
jgi:squalene-hopene/tetraprenyl-beta-curcumene cyclase